MNKLILDISLANIKRIYNLELLKHQQFEGWLY